jgi:four helix bundle protein
MLTEEKNTIKINSYKDLIVWKKAIELATEVYKLTAKFPKDEIYSLTSQVKRAACSVSLNIAEGHGRGTTKNYVSFLYIAQGSLRETESALILAIELNFIKSTDCEKVNLLIEEETKMLHSLIQKLENKM